MVFFLIAMIMLLGFFQVVIPLILIAWMLWALNRACEKELNEEEDWEDE